MLFESLCTVCSSMFRQWIWKKINEIKKSHAHHIYVAYETVGLLSWISSCRTIDRIPYNPYLLFTELVYFWTFMVYCKTTSHNFSGTTLYWWHQLDVLWVVSARGPALLLSIAYLYNWYRKGTTRRINFDQESSVELLEKKHSTFTYMNSVEYWM